MYIDESGDVGNVNSPTNYFILSSLIFQENHWQNLLDDLIVFRKGLKLKYNLKLREEIHASYFINGGGLTPQISLINRYNRLMILRDCLDWLNSRNEISIISIRMNKLTCASDVFETTWGTLIQRFENTLLHNNFPGPQNNDKGIIISDNTDGGKLTRLLRKMRKINYIPNNNSLYSGGSRNMPLRNIIEDPILRDSQNSFFHQMVDVVAYFAKQYYTPNLYIKKKKAKEYYGRLNNVVNQNVTTKNSYMKIVEI